MADPAVKKYNIVLNGKQFEVLPGEVIAMYLTHQQVDGVAAAKEKGPILGTQEVGPLSDVDLQTIRDMVENDKDLSTHAGIMRTVEREYWKKRLNETSQSMDRTNIADEENWWHLDVPREGFCWV